MVRTRAFDKKAVALQPYRQARHLCIQAWANEAAHIAIGAAIRAIEDCLAADVPWNTVPSSTAASRDVRGACSTGAETSAAMISPVRATILPGVCRLPLSACTPAGAAMAYKLKKEAARRGLDRRATAAPQREDFLEAINAASAWEAAAGPGHRKQTSGRFRCRDPNRIQPPPWPRREFCRWTAQHSGGRK